MPDLNKKKIDYPALHRAMLAEVSCYQGYKNSKT